MPPLSSMLAPGLDDVVRWIQYQVRTMDDTTFTLALAGLVAAMGLVMAGLRPKR